MKIKLLLITIILFSFSCKKETKSLDTTDYKNEKLDIATTIYPENISKIFDAHGTLDNWKTFNNLVFEIEKSNGNEKTTTALKSRKSLIEAPNFAIGYNGKDVWLKENDTSSYKGNARFYYNLMFYFYAMPFVLADNGINYKDVEPIVYNEVEYPGIKISYESGVGESPEDEYIIYYNKETNEMEWLGYTVTYFTKEKSKDFHFIKYNDWQTVEGMKLPKTLEWYNYENGKVTTKRNSMNFVSILLSKEKPNNQLFSIPENAKIIE